MTRVVLQDAENLKQNSSVISCSGMAVGKDGKKAMKPLSSVTLNNSCYPEFFYFLHEATCTFPDAVSGISLSILVLALRLIDINWLFLSSLFSFLLFFISLPPIEELKMCLERSRQSGETRTAIFLTGSKVTRNKRSGVTFLRISINV